MTVTRAMTSPLVRWVRREKRGVEPMSTSRLDESSEALIELIAATEYHEGAPESTRHTLGCTHDYISRLNERDFHDMTSFYGDNQRQYQCCASHDKDWQKSDLPADLHKLMHRMTGHYATIVLKDLKKQSLEIGTPTIGCLLFLKRFGKNDSQ
ncbi:hypothetical protein EVAR_39707_1 [Eumeta japonica]|uniref:Uncharacterized protein n=1 Tax=Eumeta variegata TaxID=151549 RepID=A0A4C1W5Z1_EUMVA|nr:hypothetical protein EVAR_39707_1 [Eumeta japonica]